MNRNSLAVGLAFGFVTTLALGRAEAGQIPFRGSLSGTCVSTEMDIDRDGEPTGRAHPSEHGHDGDGRRWNAGEYGHGDAVEQRPVPVEVLNRTGPLLGARASRPPRRAIKMVALPGHTQAG